MKRGPLKLFYSYAHEDEHIRDKIDEHLELLKRQNLIIGWHDRHIVPGTEWNEAINESLKSADIVLLLLSKAFMASEYIRDVEIPEAMKAHKSSKVRVVPVIIEKIDNWEKLPFAKLQILPAEAKPILDWEDSVKAYQNIADGIRKVAKDIIIKGGGPFEFGPHPFTEAELSELPKDVRQRTLAGLARLQTDLQNTIPPRKYESNLIMATWALNKFGKKSNNHNEIEKESLFYMAQVISSYDLVALQEIDRNIKRLESLKEILGPDWGTLLTDIAPGARGNNERFAILYYKPRIEFQDFSSQVVLPPKRINGKNQPSKQFSRPPLIAAFSSGHWAFQLCTAHIVWGAKRQESLEENHMLGEYLKKRSRYDNSELFLLGEFQMGTLDSPILDVLRNNDVQIPEEVLHPSTIRKNKYYDLIGFVSSGRKMPLTSTKINSGCYDIFEQVFREEDFNIYDKYMTSTSNEMRSSNQKLSRYRTWKSFLISDHLPLWVELKIPDEL